MNWMDSGVYAPRARGTCSGRATAAPAQVCLADTVSAGAGGDHWAGWGPGVGVGAEQGTESRPRPAHLFSGLLLNFWKVRSRTSSLERSESSEQFSWRRVRSSGGGAEQIMTRGPTPWRPGSGVRCGPPQFGSVPAPRATGLNADTHPGRSPHAPTGRVQLQRLP